MTQPTPQQLENRILVLAPTRRDAALTHAMFEQARIGCLCCADLQEVCAELDRGAAAVILPEESIVHGEHDCLVSWLSRQATWSDLPILMLARPGADSAIIASAMDLLGNVTVLERPTRVAALISSVRTAQRARAKQYQIREHLAERERNEEALRTNDRRKDEFLAILAHELRNPLAPIRNAFMVLRMAGQGNPLIVEMSEMMERQVNHLVRLVDDLLEISRITRGKIELRKQTVELADVIRNAVESSQPLIESSGHRLHVSVPKLSLCLQADPVRLAQVFANLLNNAAKYTDAEGTINLEVIPSGDWVSISIRDTGRGIPANMLTQIFELFAQVDNAPGRSQSGLGIGLTLVKSLIEMHGGTIEAKSEGPNQGSEFIVRLPLELNVSHEDCQPEARDSVQEALQRRVLVVDDNQDAADSLSLLLKLLGAEVQVAYSGPDALERLPEWRPSIMLLDIGMPGMDGHEVARRIRARPDFEHVKIVALTGWGQEEDLRRSRAAGFDHHLTKPADMDSLKRLLANVGTTDTNGAS